MIDLDEFSAWLSYQASGEEARAGYESRPDDVLEHEGAARAFNEAVNELEGQRAVFVRRRPKVIALDSRERTTLPPAELVQMRSDDVDLDDFEAWLRGQSDLEQSRSYDEDAAEHEGAARGYREAADEFACRRFVEGG